MEIQKRRVIDMHAHVFPLKIAEKAVGSICKFYDIPMHGTGTTEDIIDQAKACNVEKILVHSTATKQEQVVSINNFIMQEIDAHKELVGYGTLHPDFENIPEEVERMISGGLKGVKLHPDFQKFNLDDPKAFGIYEACEGRIPILFHIGDFRQDYSDPQRLMRVMEKFPGLKVIAAHFGGWSVWEKSYEVLEPNENLYFDTSSSLYFLKRDLVCRFIEKHGIDKFMYGTDYPMWDIKEEIERILALDLGKEETDKILYRNAAAFLGL